MMTTETTRRLVVVAPGPLEHHVFEITRARVLVGCSAEADLQLDAPHVSRIHALFEQRDSCTVVHDLSSTHGTTVNGTRLVQPYALRDGDVVGIGSFELRFEERSCDAEDAGIAVPQASLTVVDDHYASIVRQEHFLRGMARTKGDALWLIGFGFLCYAIAGVLTGIGAYASAAVGTTLVVVGLAMHVVAGFRTREVLRAPSAWAGAR
jgi:hypothetical protein